MWVSKTYGPSWPVTGIALPFFTLSFLFPAYILTPMLSVNLYKVRTWYSPEGTEENYENTSSRKAGLITLHHDFRFQCFSFSCRMAGNVSCLFHSSSNDFFNFKGYVASHVRTNECMIERKGFGGERDLCEYNIPAFPTVTEKSHDILKPVFGMIFETGTPLLQGSLYSSDSVWCPETHLSMFVHPVNINFIIFAVTVVRISNPTQ
jgi:hypothetical protein